jgi:hypothetical protein
MLFLRLPGRRRQDPNPVEAATTAGGRLAITSSTADSAPAAPKYRYVYVSEVSQESPVLSLAMSPDGRRFFTAVCTCLHP